MRETLKKLRDTLRPIYGAGETQAIIRIMFHYLKGWDTVDILIHESDELSPFMKSEVDKILSRLMNHEPIQYITGEARFNGLTLKVTPDVLIPRPETDELVDIIVKENSNAEDLRILDIATGSGCIAIALSRALKFSHVSALDVSDKALKVAEENAKKLKTDIKFIHADIFKWMPDDKYDIIVSNPPYIDESEKNAMEPNVLDHEPASALFVPDDNPLIFYKRITQIARDALSAKGELYFEINPRHADELSRHLSSEGFVNVEIIRDSFGKQRFIKASQNEE